MSYLPDAELSSSQFCVPTEVSTLKTAIKTIQLSKQSTK